MWCRGSETCRCGIKDKEMHWERYYPAKKYVPLLTFRLLHLLSTDLTTLLLLKSPFCRKFLFGKLQKEEGKRIWLSVSLSKVFVNLSMPPGKHVQNTSATRYGHFSSQYNRKRSFEDLCANARRSSRNVYTDVRCAVVSQRDTLQNTSH